MYEGKHYKFGEKINDYGNYGLQCGKWGITAWENYQGISLKTLQDAEIIV